MAKSRPLEWLGYQNAPAGTSDLRSLSPEELEELAGATATAIIKAAHQREREAEKRASEVLSAAMTEADRLRREAESTANKTMAEAQRNASSLIESANASSEKTLKNSERQSAKIINEATKQSEDIISNARREAVRIHHEMEQNMKSAKDQMNTALAKFNASIQVQLQAVRQVAMKSEHIESELSAAREAITKLASMLFGNDKAAQKKDE